MNISVIGAGNTGIALSIHLNLLGYNTLLFTRSNEKAAYLNQNPVKAFGALTGNFQLKATCSMEEIVNHSDILIISTLGNAHDEVLNSIYRLKDVNVIILNANWGGYQAYCIREKYFPHSNSEIIESSGMPYISKYSLGEVNISAVKSTIDIASTSKKISPVILELFNKLYNQVIIKNNIIETSIAAPNPIIHIPLALFNIIRIEHGETFNILTDGFSKRAENYILHLDQERAAIAAKFNIPYIDILSLLNGYWNDHYPSLTELYQNNPVYKNVKAPTQISHRFITEDMPFGIVPIVSLGKLLNIETPYADALISIFKLYFKELDCENHIPFDLTTLSRIVL